MPHAGRTARKSKAQALRGWLAVSLIGLTVALLLGWLDRSLLGLEDRSLDLRFCLRGPRSVEHSPLILIEVDNRSYKDLNERWPFPRGYHAELLRNLKRAGVELIVLDIQFTEKVSADALGDSLLAAAVAECAPVILAGEMPRTRRGYKRLDLPLPELLATGQPWGLVNDLQDADGVNRLYFLYLPDPLGEKLIPTIGMQTLLYRLNAEQSISDPGLMIPERHGNVIQLDSLEICLASGLSNAIRINYYGPAGTFPSYSYSDILDDADFDLADPEMDTDYMEQWSDPELYELLWGDEPHPFRGKIALVGVSAEDLHDNKRTPFFGYQGARELMPGVETHAHALQTMLDHSYIQTATPGMLYLLQLILLALLAGFLVSRIGPLRTLAVLLVVSALWMWVAYFLFANYNLWLQLVTPLATLLLTWLTGTVHQFLLARREKAQIRGMFAQYVPEAVVAELIRTPEKLSLGGEEREMTALFSDVAGFTTISEGMTPSELVLLLNEYLTAMTDCIVAEGGIIDKYEGDAIMAEFGAPLPAEDHADRAIRAAVAMQTKLEEMRGKWGNEGRPQLRARVGINSGQMVVGNMGSRQIFDYTAMGDAVNLASRLEGVNKFYDSELMVSGMTWGLLREKAFGRRLDVIRVKGKKEPVEVWEILGLHANPQAERFQQRIDRWNEALRAYEHRDWQEAAELFQALHAEFPEDLPARVLGERCRGFVAERPAADWDLVTVMTEK